MFSRFTPPVGRAFGNFLFLTYVAIKVLYFLNVILQLFLLHLFFGNNPNYSVLHHGLWVIQGWSVAHRFFSRSDEYFLLKNEKVPLTHDLE